MTNRKSAQVLTWFSGFEVEDYAKQGFVATSDLILEAGPLPQQFAVSMANALRKLGLNIQVETGKLSLLVDFVVTKTGMPISAEQSKLLVHLDVKLVKFRASVLCRWSGGSFEIIEG